MTPPAMRGSRPLRGCAAGHRRAAADASSAVPSAAIVITAPKATPR